jgi:hypothetical protein
MIEAKQRRLVAEISRLEVKRSHKELYSISAWQRRKWRHRSSALSDYIAGLIGFIPFAGDRKFGDDPAIVAVRPFRGRALRHRPREGLRHRKPDQAQFRHGAPGGLPQGGAPDGTG